MPSSKPSYSQLTFEQMNTQREAIHDGYFEHLPKLYPREYANAPAPDPTKETTVLRDIHHVLVAILVEMTLANDMRFQKDE